MKVLSEKEKVAAFDKLIAKRNDAHARRNARIALYVVKAKAAKLVVTEAEVEAYIKAKK